MRGQRTTMPFVVTDRNGMHGPGPHWHARSRTALVVADRIRTRSQGAQCNALSRTTMTCVLSGPQCHSWSRTVVECMVRTALARVVQTAFAGVELDRKECVLLAALHAWTRTTMACVDTDRTCMRCPATHCIHDHGPHRSAMRGPDPHDNIASERGPRVPWNLCLGPHW